MDEQGKSQVDQGRMIKVVRHQLKQLNTVCESWTKLSPND